MKLLPIIEISINFSEYYGSIYRNEYKIFTFAREEKNHCLYQ